MIKFREVGGSIIRASSQPPSFPLLGVPSFPPGAGQELKELRLKNAEMSFFSLQIFIKKFLKHVEKLKELYYENSYITQILQLTFYLIFV